MLKYIFVIFVFALSSTYADLNRHRRLGDNTQYCCRVPIQDTIKNFTQNVPVQYYKNVTYMIVNGTRFCKPGEKSVLWDHLHMYCDNTIPVIRQELLYRLETVTKNVYEKGVCPQNEVICCKGYTEYQGNCYTEKEMEGLNALSGLEGLLGRRR